jgi:arsenate reductase
MAASFFNAIVDPARARALSAGTRPATQVHPEVVEAMREIGVDLSSARPQRLTDEFAAKAQILITMGCEEACPVVPGARLEDWPIEDPKGGPLERVRAIRDEICGRIRQLITAEGWGQPSL